MRRCEILVPGSTYSRAHRCEITRGLVRITYQSRWRTLCARHLKMFQDMRRMEFYR